MEYIIQSLYGDFMADTTQVAFTLSDRALERLDALVPDRFPSRAAALRAAVHDWLEVRTRHDIDQALEQGYADVAEDTAMTDGLAVAAKRALADREDLDW
jgi:Arc/MetJ-type ribon-helix-helix transcriptional regulator